MMPLVLQLLQPFGRLITAAANAYHKLFGPREPGMLPVWAVVLVWLYGLPARIWQRLHGE